MEIPSKLPEFLKNKLDGRGLTDEDTWRMVTQLELYGCHVVVRRLYLGAKSDPKFGTTEIIYETGKKGGKHYAS